MNHKKNYWDPTHICISKYLIDQESTVLYQSVYSLIRWYRVYHSTSLKLFIAHIIRLCFIPWFHVKQSWVCNKTKYYGNFIFSLFIQKIIPTPYSASINIMDLKICLFYYYFHKTTFYNWNSVNLFLKIFSKTCLKKQKFFFCHFETYI